MYWCVFRIPHTVRFITELRCKITTIFRLPQAFCEIVYANSVNFDLHQENYHFCKKFYFHCNFCLICRFCSIFPYVVY